MENVVTVGERVYYARVLIPVDVFDVCDCIVRMVGDTWFSAYEEKTKQAFIFNNKDLGVKVFKNRNDALEVVKDGEKHRRKISSERDTSED